VDPLVVFFVLVALVLGLGIGFLLGARRARPAGPASDRPTRSPAMAGRTSAVPAAAGDGDAQGSAADGGTSRLGSEGRVVTGLSGLGVIHVTDDLVVDEANLAARMLVGPGQRGLSGRTVMEVFLDRRVEDLVRSAPRVGSLSEDLTVRDDEVRELRVRARRSPAGGVWLVLEDVSELRRLQRIRTEFIDNLSHELRTPLTNIGLLAETLARDLEAAGDAVQPRTRDRVAKIEVETGNLAQMVNEMLDLSRIESGGPIALLEIVDPIALSVAATDRLRVFADRQGVRLDVDAQHPVRAVRGDEDRLAQVLVNLVHNAIKFSPDGGAVVVHVTGRDEEVSIAVQDGGIGIPSAAQARVFERFYKVDRARVRGGGTGLGLAIARHIVEAHGGRIELVSSEGVGSTFTVVLPVAADLDAPGDRHEPSAPGRES
jgi:two-component system phosphate regulon sensor histidine kinase PhoR